MNDQMLPAFLTENEVFFSIFFLRGQHNHAPLTTPPRICAVKYVRFIPFIGS